MKNSKITYIDLFAGAGGLSEGFIEAGFKPIAHVEMDKAACFTLKTRMSYHYLKSANKPDTYKAYLKGDISREELYSHVPDDILDTIINLPIGTENNEYIHKKIQEIINSDAVDLIIGGPPCQAYSLVGRARSANKMEGDPRNYLYVQYAEYLEKYQPKVFVFENVLGLKSAKKGLYLKKMEALFLEKGYNMRLYTVEANNFGVLQNRKRVIIIGLRQDLSASFPKLEEIKIESNYLVKDLLADLPSIKAGEGIYRGGQYVSNPTGYLTETKIRKDNDVLTLHIARPHSIQDKEIYRIALEKWDNEAKKRLDYNDLPERLKTHKNRKSFKDRFKVVAKDLPFSQTVVAHIAKDGHYYIHPDIEQNRSITIREAARLQSFPDNYYFEGVKGSGNRTAAFKQIGNAVPPLMANRIAIEIMKLLCQ